MGVDYNNDVFIGIIIGPNNYYYNEISSIVNGDDYDYDEYKLLHDRYVDPKERIFGISLVSTNISSFDPVYETGLKHLDILYYSGVTILKYELDYSKSYIKKHMRNFDKNSKFYKLLERLFYDDSITVNRYNYTYAT